MVSIGPEQREKALSWALIAHEGFDETAQYLRSLPESEWSGSTGCSDWTVRDLAGHVIGEAVWFANLVGGITNGEAPLPNAEYERLTTLSSSELTRRLEEAARQIEQRIAGASLEQLEQPADLVWTTMPLWRAVFISAEEAVLHNRDARVPRVANATIRSDWAVAIATPWVDVFSQMAHQNGIDDCPGTYLLQVGDGIGPVTVIVRNGKLTTERSRSGTPDVTLHLTADQFLRLTAGRLDLGSEEGHAVHLEGNRDKAHCLNRIFAGIANG